MKPRCEALPEAGLMRRAISTPLPWVLLLLLAGTVGCAQLTPAPTGRTPASNPLFWRAVSPEERVVYLFGSIHVGPDGGWAFPAPVEKAFARSKVMYVEFDARSFSEDSQALLLAEYGMLPPGVHLRDRLSKEQYAALVAALETSDFYEEDVGRLRPWMIANMLSLEAALRVGLSPAYGVDSGLLERSRGKRIVALESAELQFAAIGALDAEAEAQALADTLALGAARGENASALAEAWQSGDQAQLESLLYEDLDESADSRALFEAMVFERNVGMVEMIEAEVAATDPKIEHFVVVGAAHFIGERNIRELLEASGYRVERIEADAR